MNSPVKPTRPVLNSAVARVLKRLHYPLEIMLLCVRWYVAYPLSLRQLGLVGAKLRFATVQRRTGIAPERMLAATRSIILAKRYSPGYSS